MANMATASGVYQQMIVPDPYHFHQPQCQLVPNMTNNNIVETKKEPRKRKKVVDKSVAEKKKTRVASQANFSSSRTDVASLPVVEKVNKTEACPVCNKRKCFRHPDAKNRTYLTKKTPDDVVILLKKHMLKLLSSQDFGSCCKVDHKNNQIDIDIAKMHQSYLAEYEPQAIEMASSQDNGEAKPKVKKWLYRKIFLDEFKTFDYNSCKSRLGDLRRNIDTVVLQKKKKVLKQKIPTPQPNSNQMIPQDYSLNNHSISNGTQVDMSRSTIIPGVIGPSGHNPTSSPVGYQSNLMSLGVESNNVSPASTMPMGGATQSIHNSLATYMTQQVPTNLLFGLGQQQQPPPTQQQPLNLQTSHQPNMQPPGHQPAGVPHSASAPPLPLNLHNPYYVSFAPMLPLHMSPQHNHQQQFQSNLMQPQPQPHNFNQHAMYQ